MIHTDFRSLERTLAHELTHVALRQLDLPLWIEEGLAQMFDRSLGGEGALQINGERAKKHQRFWKNHGLGQFWEGSGFQKATPAQGFSYELAEILLTLLVAEHHAGWLGLNRHRQQRFLSFLAHAKAEDGGESASQEFLGYGLSELAEKFLGPTDSTTGTSNEMAGR